ncbi:hypothetical protein [Streptomyces sp. NPDC020951]|uniref:hypothetical protein n=1 Tax=Streptomyces sp. NPDC020951 TaxID=3365104 RepID=UPI0037B0B206
MQLFVLVALMAVQAVAVAVAVALELIARARITDAPGHGKAPPPLRWRIPLLNARRRRKTEPPDQTHKS